MSHARLALLAASALGAAAGCTSTPTSTAGAQLRQPSAIAVFEGRTLHDPANLVPYLAIANAGRNDLTLVDARTDTVVEAPVRLRPLAVPFPDRPTLLVSSDLGDGGPDLLVGVSAGDSVLQLVRTWAADSGIEGTASVDLAGEDILALAALPAQPAGEARLVAALAGGRLAVVHYVRSASSEAIEAVAPEVHDVGFQPVALAALSADPAAPAAGGFVYAATLDPLGPGATQGVAEIDVRAAGPWPVRALDARGPTRLVAAARLLERKRGALEPDEAAFAGQAPVARVYAVLDEGGCGPHRRIDCGLVALDPAKVPGTGDDHIPEDDWSRADGASVMPYRAPIQFEAVRPLVLAVATPPAFPAETTQGYMRLQLDPDSSTVTTAVGVVATDNGQIQFLDLGRFRIASSTPVPVGVTAGTGEPPYVDTPDEANPEKRSRLWLWDSAVNDFAEDAAAGAKTIGVTPGYTPRASAWTVTYQGVFPGLEGRSAEVGWDGTNVWLAIQVGEGPLGAHVTSQVARIYHPALGIAAEDVVVIRNRDAAGNPICTLTPPNTTTEQVDMDFEVRVAGFLPPTRDHPGGAVSLKADPSSAEWGTCLANLQARALTDSLVPRLLVTIRSGELLLLRGALYAGRPALDADYVLQYPAGPGDEDALAAACPLVDWDGVFRELAPPPVCDSAACRADCEKVVLARLARRVHHLSESCDTSPGTPDPSCNDSYGTALPFLNGPAVKFRVGVQLETPGIPAPHRKHSLTFSTGSGAQVLADLPDGTTVQANGALAFDPSTAAQPSEAYRFFVSYPGNQVVDVSPNQSPITRTAIR